MDHFTPPVFLFDLYGTLVDIRTDEESASFWEAFAQYLAPHLGGYDVRASYLALCKEAESRLPEGGEIDLLPVFGQLAKTYSFFGSAESLARYFRARSTQKLALFPWTRSLLRGLARRGARRYLLSNAQACFTRDELDALRLSDCFDGIVLSSEIGWKKPSPQFFGRALARFSLRPEECLYVGNDLWDDVAGARNFGVRSVYLQTEQSRPFPAIEPDLETSAHGIKPLLFRFAEGKERS